MSQTEKSLRKEQAHYKRNFDARLHEPRYEIQFGSFIYLRKKQGTSEEPKHILSQVSTGPYRVVNAADDKIFINKAMSMSSYHVLALISFQACSTARLKIA